MVPQALSSPRLFPHTRCLPWLLFPPRAKAKIRCPSKRLSCVPESDRFSFHYFLLSREAPISHRGQCRHRRPAETYFWKQTPQSIVLILPAFPLLSVVGGASGPDSALQAR